jgi:hypothetical protein
MSCTLAGSPQLCAIHIGSIKRIAITKKFDSKDTENAKSITQNPHLTQSNPCSCSWSAEIGISVCNMERCLLYIRAHELKFCIKGCWDVENLSFIASVAAPACARHLHAWMSSTTRMGGIVREKGLTFIYNCGYKPYVCVCVARGSYP